MKKLLAFLVKKLCKNITAKSYKINDVTTEERGVDGDVEDLRQRFEEVSKINPQRTSLKEDMLEYMKSREYTIVSYKTNILERYYKLTKFFTVVIKETSTNVNIYTMPAFWIRNGGKLICKNTWNFQKDHKIMEEFTRKKLQVNLRRANNSASFIQNLKTDGIISGSKYDDNITDIILSM